MKVAVEAKDISLLISRSIKYGRQLQFSASTLGGWPDAASVEYCSRLLGEITADAHIDLVGTLSQMCHETAEIASGMVESAEREEWDCPNHQYGLTRSLTEEGICPFCGL